MAALLPIECQNEWLHPSGKLYPLMKDRKPFEKSVAQIEKALLPARRTGMPAISCHVWFAPGHPWLSEGKAGLRKAIPGAGTHAEGNIGAEFYPSLAPLPQEIISSGRTGGCAYCFRSAADRQQKSIDALSVAGYALPVCVESAVREVGEGGHHETLLSDATAALPKKQPPQVLHEVLRHNGDTLTTEPFVNPS